MSIAVIRDKLVVAPDLLRLIGHDYRVIPLHLDQLHRLDRIDADIIIADLDALPHQAIRDYGGQLERLRRPSQTALAICRRDQRRVLADAGLLKGGNTMHRPLDDSNFTSLLRGLSALHVMRSSGRSRLAQEPLLERGTEFTAGVNAATDTLDCVFSIGSGNRAITQDELNRNSMAIAAAVEAHGLKGWVDSVREHHDPTYQHCLLVTGAAVAFGRHVGFCARDVDRVTTGALLHDVGKVAVPIDILDKPGKLTPEEFATIRTHTTAGLSMLSENQSFEPEMLDLVLSHHEYLDGSGYPNGKLAAAIPDLVRVITIADIFAALIERRAYKEPMTHEAAYNILLTMHGKLDMPLVRAQRSVLLAA